ncbi:MAG: lysophospholipid acyltransferase family protein [Pyrinomonadaceae bacterium]
MLKANKSVVFERLFSVYNRNLVKRRFVSLRVSGLENLEGKCPDLPLISFANHSSWWDGLILFELFTGFSFENYVLMEEKNLRRFWLFRKLGAFSIVPGDPRETLKSLNYAVKLLKENPKTNLLVFPQGSIIPNDKRPVKFYNGLARIIEKAGTCSVLPIALRYEFLEDFKPTVFINVGKIKHFENKTFGSEISLTDFLEKKLTEVLDEVVSKIINQDFNNFIKLL